MSIDVGLQVAHIKSCAQFLKPHARDTVCASVDALKSEIDRLKMDKAEISWLYRERRKWD